MPFNLSSGVSNLLSSDKESEDSMLNSSLYTALIMTTILILIILTMYPCSKKASTWRRLKAFLYIFGATFFILVLHKGTIVRVLNNTHKETSSERLLSNMGSGTTVAETIEVQPKTMTGGLDELEKYTV